MDIATKLTQIAEKEAQNIELNTQLEQTLYGTDTGGKSYYDEFWDAFQDNGNRIDYSYGFYGWNGEYIRPKYKVIPKYEKTTNFLSGVQPRYLHLVYQCPNLKKIEKKYFDLSQYYYETGYDNQSTYGNYYTFANNPNLEEIEDVGLQPYAYYCTFRWCPKLHTIEIIRSNEQTIFDLQTFNSDINLQNITIEGVINSSISFHHSTQLTKKSILSVINALMDEPTTDTPTVTFTKVAVNNAFATEKGLADGSTSDEWKTLIATKPNWTVSLV